MNQGTREHILDSAAALILRDGAGSLTLDRVAREAGISKGGLLYHFNNKERLIEALIERMIAHFESDIQRQERSDPQPAPGSRTRAFVRASIHAKPRLFSALLATISNDPALLEPLRTRYAQWQATFEQDRITPARATVVRLAADGLWFAELLGLTSFTAAQRRDIVNEMLRLTTAPVRKPRAKRATA